MRQFTWTWKGNGFEPGDAMSVRDRGVRHGMSFFETLRIENGRPLFLEPHLGRLRESANILGWSMPKTFLSGAEALLNGNHVSCGTARVYLTAGEGGPGEKVHKPCGFVWIEPCKIPFAPLKPAALDGQFGVYHSVAPVVKTGNYWQHHHARAVAVSRGFDEAVLVNGSGELVSGAMANLFAVVDGILCTPRVQSGARNGVVREWVLARRTVQRRRMEMNDLLEADEIFLTSSGIGIRSVSAVGEREYSPGPATRSLAAEYFAEASW